MWVDTGQRLVNIASADRIEVVREISDVRSGDRDVWTYHLAAAFGDRQEFLASVATYPPRDAQALDDLSGSAALAHSRKSRHAQAAAEECLRCLRAIADALREKAPYCSLEGLYSPSLDPEAVEREG